MLKGCATPGFEVAAGAPEAARGVAVVEVSAVMGVEAREGVVLRVRARLVVGWSREARVRQRVQIMVVVVSCCVVLAWRCNANGYLNRCLWSGSSRGFKSQNGRAAQGSRRRRSEVWLQHVTSCLCRQLKARYIISHNAMK